MARAIRTVRRTSPGKPGNSIAGDGERGLVTCFGLLAENLPSLLKRLRPMDASSRGVVRYLQGIDARRANLAARFPMVAHLAVSTAHARSPRPEIKTVRRRRAPR